MSTTIESLELEIKSNSTKAVKGIDALTQSLAKLKEATKGGIGLSSVAKDMDKVSSSSKKAKTSFEGFKKTTQGVSDTNKKATSSFSELYAKMKVGVAAVKMVGKALWSAIDNSNDYIENVNLFNVAMGEYASGAMDYAESVSNAMGIDTSDWIRAQGVFMTLSTGFGVASDRANTMSRNLTQLGYDLSSFFNISTEDAMQKLQSGLSGELEPLRRLGYDLSQAKLEATALELGIDKSVSSMTQAEKAQLRYYAIMTQVTSAQGDMARTLDDPANQLRVLKAEFSMATREIGNAFIPALNAILPYVIAATRVIRTLASSIAGLFGYEAPEISDSMGKVVENTDAVSEGLKEGQEEAKKLKSYMLGFDELNVINPNEGSSSSAEDTSSGFDFDLPEYDFMSGLVDSKVDEIVEDMKEWLGITEDISSWAELFETRLGKILTAVGLIGGALALWKIGNGVTKAFGAIGSLFGKKGGGTSGGTGGLPKITSPKAILQGLLNVAIIIGGVIALVAAVGLLTQIPGFNDIIHEGLSALATVFTGLIPALIPIALVSAGMVVIGKVKVSQVAKGLANAAIIIGGTTALITAIGALISIPYFSDFLSTGIKSTQDTFNGLYDIAVPIGILSAYMVVIGLVSPATIALGLAGFAIVIGGAVTLITAIGALLTIPGFDDFLSTGITSVKNAFNGLYDIAVPIGVLSALLIALGIATPATILSGLAGFALIVGGFEALLVALGALKQIPGFTWIVDEGADVLAQLGNSLGKFAGSIVGGFAEGVSDSFPKIGQNLADFMTKAEPFFKGLASVNADSVDAVKNLAAMVLVLTAADILDGLTAWFTGGNSLGKFGKSLKDFAPDFVAYATAIKDVDAEAVKASSIAAQSIVEFANNIPNEGGMASWFAGENSIDVFGKKLPEFGKCFKEYGDNIKGLDGDAVVNSANAAKAIVEIAQNIPNSGGISAWFTGENDIDTWGEKLPSFGKNIKKYADSVKGLDTGVVTNSTNAAKSIVELAKSIPNEGGVVSWFTGDNGIEKFGGKLAAFGKKFKEYYDTVKSMSTTTINNITTCISKIVDFAVRIKNEVDTKKVDSFTDAIADLGKAIKNLPTSKTITITVEQVNKSSEVDSIWDAIGKLPLFASGGFPEQGQMFIAREAGAEMVGSIGRKTAVANNDQIVEGIAGGVAEANSEQNALLREQNSLLRAILEKDSGTYLDGRRLTNSVEKYQRERGRVLITGGAL